MLTNHIILPSLVVTNAKMFSNKKFCKMNSYLALKLKINELYLPKELSITSSSNNNFPN